MPHYAVRVTHSWLQAQSIAHTWALRADKVLVYEHSQETQTARDKIHIHMLLVNTSIDKKQLRNLAKETNVPTKGNENMSFKMAEEPFTKYITYMSKGVLNPVYNKGFTTEELEEYRLLWIEPANYFKKNAYAKLYDEYAKVALPVPTAEERAHVIEQWVNSDRTSTTPPSATALYMERFKKHSYNWLCQRYGEYHDPSFGRYWNSLKITHCWKNKLPLDQTWKL